MSFATNQSQQLNLFNATANLIGQEKRLLEKSWTKYFAEKIFLKIDKALFSVLYSDHFFRHNILANAIIGTLILKKSLDSRIKKSWTRFRLTSVISTPCTQPTLTFLHFPTYKWQIMDDYISAIYGCFTAYATDASRIQRRSDSYQSANTGRCLLGYANLVLDTLENNAIPISWQLSNRPELAQAIANVLADLAKEEWFLKFWCISKSEWETYCSFSFAVFPSY